jgi:hypothetical protein
MSSTTSTATGRSESRLWWIAKTTTTRTAARAHHHATARRTTPGWETTATAASRSTGKSSATSFRGLANNGGRLTNGLAHSLRRRSAVFAPVLDPVDQ